MTKLLSALPESVPDATADGEKNLSELFLHNEELSTPSSRGSYSNESGSESKTESSTEVSVKNGRRSSLKAIFEEYSDAPKDPEMPVLEPIDCGSPSGYRSDTSDPPSLIQQIANGTTKMAFLDTVITSGPSTCSALATQSNTDVFDLNQLLLKSSFLKIPLLSGLERTVVERAEDGPSCEVYYRVKDTQQLLKNLDEVHEYLMKNNLNIPIVFFSFDPEILINAVHKTDPEMILMEDLSEGQERVPIPVIAKSRQSRRGRLGKYVAKSFLAEDLKKTLNLDHTEEFLVCCDCPNDCKDKMNCPCFLKTLDNCSEGTRRLLGDEKVGYNHQRLYRECLSGIFECNKLCKCHKQTCFNRVIQNGMFCNLQIFMTRMKGWGVRTMVDIPKGTFVCTYAGKIVDSKYADEASRDWNAGRWKYLSELRIGEEGKPGYEEEAIEPLETTDAPSNLEEESSSLMEEVVECSSSSSAVELVVPPLPAVASTSVCKPCSMDVDLESSEVRNPSNQVPVEVEHNPNPEASKFSDRGNPLPVPTRVKKANSVLVPSDRQLRQRATGEVKTKDEIDLYPVRRLYKIRRTPEELNLAAMLTYRSFLKHKSSGASEADPYPPMITKFIFKEDLHEYYPSRIHSKNEKRFQKAANKKRKDAIKARNLKLLKSTRIHQQLAEDVARSIKLPESQSQRPIYFQRKHPEEVVAKRVAYHSRFPVKRLLKRAAVCINRKAGPGNTRSVVSKRLGSKKSSKQVHTLLDFSLNIDGLAYKNIGGYINHSCNPNIFPQYAFWDCHDLRFPVIGFFTSRNIRRGEELCWNYKYETEEFLKGADKRNKELIALPCYCNEDNCTRTMYSPDLP